METTEKKLRENARKALLVAIKVAAKEGGITAAKEFAEAYDLLAPHGVDEDQNVPPGSA